MDNIDARSAFVRPLRGSFGSKNILRGKMLERSGCEVRLQCKMTWGNGRGNC